MNFWHKKLGNLHTYFFLFLILTVIGCSSAKELVGHWKHGSGNDVEEYVITNKSVTYSYIYGTKRVSTKPYKVFERDQSFVVLEIGRESKGKLTESKELVRFDLISKDKIIVEGKTFIRVK